MTDLRHPATILPAAMKGPGASAAATGRRLRAGIVLPAFSLTATTGERLDLPDGRNLVHLQFRRFAGCPICNLHLSSFVRRHEDLREAGIQEIVLFHSGREALLRHVAGLPFPVIPDPHRALYRAFGVGAGRQALTDPRAWPTVLRTLGHVAAGALTAGRRLPPLHAEGGRLGLPADVLIDRDGRILAVKYGAHADDQWSVDALLAIAAGGSRQA